MVDDENATTFSIVVPAFNEDSNLLVLYSAIVEAMSDVDGTWELLFVDDGSGDETWSSIVELNDSDERVRGIRLSRNFGHQNALSAGLEHSRGQAVISMDSDMQHPPALLPRLIEGWRDGAMIVKTRRLDPPDLPVFKRLTSKWFYRTFSWLSGVNLEEGMADYRLLDRAVLDELLQLPENTLFLRGLVEWVGYPSTTIEYESGRRHSGQTKYTPGKMLRFAWQGVSSFSIVPLRIGIATGLSASALSFIAMMYAVISKLSHGAAVPGWASSLAITSFLFGILFLYLGLLGEYLGRILIQVRQRPRYLLSEQTPTASRPTSATSSGGLRVAAKK